MMVTRPRTSSSLLDIAMATAIISIRLSTHTAAFLGVVPCTNHRRMGTHFVINSKSSLSLVESESQFSRIRRLFSTDGNAKTQNDSNQIQSLSKDTVPLYRSEGLFAVAKPLEWTSNDVVSYIRGILERDARSRGAKPVRVGSRRNKSRIVKVGHGGTLDPLATGVLVIGVGKGTKQLQSYLSGSKAYTATAELGFETTTLDMDPTANITKKESYDHVTVSAIEEVLPDFQGKIMQVPPIFSALKKGGKKLYESAREGVSVEDVKIEAREVHVYDLKVIDPESIQLPRFDIHVECGGGTYIRSLIRDMGYKLETVATTVRLERTKQGPFTLGDCIEKSDWDADNIYNAIDQRNSMLKD